MLNHENELAKRPYAVLGAGDLVSHLQRQSEEGDVARYRFNIFRETDAKSVTHSLRPCDLRCVIKLCQVLAFTIADDGWLSSDLRQELFQLAEELDQITHKWEAPDHGPETSP
jgi:hypothetical protein